MARAAAGAADRAPPRAAGDQGLDAAGGARRSAWSWA
jgi:hypothetical protein